MIRAKPLKLSNGSAAGISEYLTHERKEEADRAVGYYNRDESPSRWGGSACDPDKVGQRVDGKELAAALEKAGGGKRKDAKCGTDLSFHPPKSVSIAALSGLNPELATAIREAHRLSVDDAMSHIEREVAATRHGKDGVEKRAATLTWAAFDHEDSRPVDGVADMQLHTHVVVLNMAVGEDGKQRKVDLAFGRGGIPLAGAVYRGALARRLRETGLELREGCEGWELACITEEQIADQSRRSQQVEDKLAERGMDRATAREDDKTAANLGTREDKRQIGHDAQRVEWNERAKAMGVDLSAVLTQQLVEPAIITSEQIEAEIAGLNEKSDVFTKQALRLALIQEHNASAFSLDAVDAAIQRAVESGQIIELGEGEVVARSSIIREREILERANSGLTKYGQAVRTPEQIKELIAAQETSQGFVFSSGQRAALELALGNEEQITAIRGYAGAGKTTAMEPTIAAAAAAGYETIGLGPSAKAVAELEGAGASRNETLARFLLTDRPLPPGEKPAPRYVVLDEAGMVSSKQMLSLLEKLRPEDKLLLVGDDRQLQSVEAGQPFAALIKEGKVKLAEIDDIRRQKVEALLEIPQLYGAGKAEEAAKKAASIMTEVEVEKQRDGETKSEALTRARAALAEAASKNYLTLSTEERARTVLLVSTNETRRMVNESVRQELQSRGEVGRDAAVIDSLTRRDLDNRQLKRLRSYKEGNVVQYSTSRGRVSASIEKVDFEGKRLELRDLKTSEMRAVRIEDMQSPQVYDRADLAVGVGDQIQFGQKADLTSGQVINGDSGRVVEIDDLQDRVIVELDRKSKDGSPARVTLSSQDCVAADRGFARTVHKAQGMTAYRAIVVAEATQQANANLAYVAMSRQTHDIKVFTNHIETQVKAYSQFSERRGALDALEQAKARIARELEQAQQREQQRERSISR